MSDKVDVKPDPKTTRVISELHGAATVLAALYDGDKPRSQLPGFTMALAILVADLLRAAE